MRIEQFLSKGSRPNRVEQFERLVEGKSKEERRKIEMEMLRPDPIPPYIGEERRYIVNSEHTVKFVFASQDEMDLFGKYIPIASYIEKSVTDLKIIFDLLNAIENGHIVYNKKNGTFLPYINREKGETKNEPKPISAETVSVSEESKPVGFTKRFFNRRKSA